MNSAELSRWNTFKRKSVTDLVKETKKMLDFVNPNIELTAAVKPNLYQARERFFQEWDVWIAAGYIDKVLIMNYSKDLKGFASNIDIIYDNLPSKYWKRIVMGIATYNQSPSEVINKIKYSRVTRFKNVSLILPSSNKSFISLIASSNTRVVLKPNSLLALSQDTL